MTPEAIQELVKLGLPGICILALAIAYLRKDKDLSNVNEKRIAESRESIKAIEQNTNTLDALSQVLRERKSTQ